jgi:hypothetical protein
MPETTHSYFDFILHGSRNSYPCVLVFYMWWKCTSTWSIFVGSLCTSPTLSSDQSFKPESRENHKLKELLRERYWRGLTKVNLPSEVRESWSSQLWKTSQGQLWKVRKQFKSFQLQSREIRKWTGNVIYVDNLRCLLKLDVWGLWMEKIRKCLPKVNFERFLLSTALRDFLEGLLWGELTKLRWIWTVNIPLEAQRVLIKSTLRDLVRSTLKGSQTVQIISAAK